jgi:hypothetical protein
MAVAAMMRSGWKKWARFPALFSREPPLEHDVAGDR